MEINGHRGERWFVDANKSLRSMRLLVLLSICKASPRPISTSQLYLTVLHFWPINPIVYREP